MHSRNFIRDFIEKLLLLHLLVHDPLLEVEARGHQDVHRKHKGHSCPKKGMMFRFHHPFHSTNHVIDIVFTIETADIHLDGEPLLRDSP